MNEPDSTLWPACISTPNSCSLRASQATELMGLPITAEATPDSSISPFL